MSHYIVNLLDLPDELLLSLFQKLSNVDALDFLFRMNNKRLKILGHDEIFSNSLDFLCYDPYKLDRFCVDILPNIHHNIKSIILESTMLKRILLSAKYPYLTKLKIYNFNQEFALNSFTDKRNTIRK